nr:response regulator transcription factor [Anaerolineae bacterium]
HTIVRQATRLYLESKGVAVVGEAVDGAAAVELVGRVRPDVAILDIHMPTLTGIEAARRIRAEYDEVRVLMLTAYNEPAYVQALLEAGADGFILKTADLGELLRAVYEVAGGGKAFDAATLRAARAHTDDAPLSEREAEVLRLASRGQTNKEIGQALFISDRTVQAHLRNIYEKLGVNTRTEAVTLALQRGWIALDRRDTPS